MPTNESDEEFDLRLCRVLAEAKTTFYKQSYFWRVLRDNVVPAADAIACVRDDGAWFEFVPGESESNENQFTVVCFNFSETGPSAIGFVAWLHSNLRTMGQTGAIVICGKDRRNSEPLMKICQGAMDYWACPVGPAGERFLGVIRTLIERGKTLDNEKAIA